MERSTFETEAIHHGYNDIASKVGQPFEQTTPHSHPFSVWGLVLEGEFILTTGGEPRSYVQGDTFTLDADCEHTEAFGPSGATYLVGRRHKAA